MLFRSFFIIYIISLLASCANKVAPTGGEKDMKPPQLLQADPPDKSINFKSKRITLTFDEYVQVKDVQQQLLVSPLMEPSPVVTVKKKSITIELPDTLRENTTYTLNFGEAIGDLHEGNPFPYQYIFSTGAVLDSFMLSGNAKDAFLQSGTKGIRVLLYRNFNDSMPMTVKPDYFSMTDESGNFTIYNISPGEYSVVALDDKNSNYKNDSRQNEAMSLPLPVTIPSNDSVALVYFTEPPADLFVKSVSNAGNRRWNVVLNKPAYDANLTFMPQTQAMYEWSDMNDTLFIWTNDTVIDTLATIITSPAGTDTAVFRPNYASRSATGRGIAISSFIESTNIENLIQGDSLAIRFSNPVSSADTSKFGLMEDSINIRCSYQFTDSIRRRMTLACPFRENRNYRILFLPGAFTDFSGKANDSISFSFMPKSLREFGTVEIHLSNAPGGGILQLLSGNNVVASKIVRKDGIYIFERLHPAPLKARIIHDANENGRWDSGEYQKHIAPEKVTYYQGEIQSRGNWEVEITWKVSD